MEQTIPVISRRLYISGATPLDIPIARHIDVAGAVTGILVVKVHAAPSGGTWTIHARNGCTSKENPGLDFIDTAREVVSVMVSGSTYNLWQASLRTPIGEELDVYLSMPAMIGYIAISVDLVLRDDCGSRDSWGMSGEATNRSEGWQALGDIELNDAVLGTVLASNLQTGDATTAARAGWRAFGAGSLEEDLFLVLRNPREDPSPDNGHQESKDSTRNMPTNAPISESNLIPYDALHVTIFSKIFGQSTPGMRYMKKYLEQRSAADSDTSHSGGYHRER